MIEKAEEALPVPLYVALHQEGCLFPFIRQEYSALLDGVISCPVSDLSTFVFSSQLTIKDRELPYPDQLEAAFVSTVFQLDATRQRAAIDELFVYFNEHYFSLKEVEQVCQTMVISVLEQYEILFRNAPDKLNLSYMAGIDLTVYNSMVVLRGLFEKDTEQLIEQLDIKKGQNKDWLIDRAEKYIKTYSTSDIKALEVADYINISSNYFSSLFKQATGQTFYEYVNTLRIEGAKTLLAETPFKVNEIAVQVGYKEYKYFVEVFKKVCGVTPTVYRKMLSEKQ